MTSSVSNALWAGTTDWVMVLVQQLQLLDLSAIEASQALRWEPLTIVFVLASASVVKGPVFVAAGAFADLRSRRRFPLAASLGLLSAALGSMLAFGLKHSFDRARPPLATSEVDPLVATPASPSFPSGHAATAFAAAALVSSFHPRLRLPLYGLATLVALSRVYLGVHFWLDIIAGAALGVAAGLSLAWAARRLRPALRLRTGF